MKKVFNLIIKQRFLIALVCLIFSVSLELNGSSLSNWINFGLRETSSHKLISFKGIEAFQKTNPLTPWLETGLNQDVLWGIPREIRSDEWNVQTPFYLSQANSDLELNNESYGDGQNMVVAYNSPVKDISIIGKPFNWGFLFLSPAKAISWYWSFKVITMLLLAFEFALILTKGKKLLSLVSAFWIVFTPAIQWWFMQHLGDVVYFTLLILVAVYHYFKSQTLIKKIGFASLIASGLIGFTLVIYPAFQVPFFYLILAFTLVMFYDAIKKKQVHKRDWLIIALTVFLSLSVIGLTVYQSFEAIKASLSTVYPGHRVSSGDEVGLNQVSDFFLNLMLPFKIPSFANQVELSSSFHFLYIMVFFLPFLWKKKDFKTDKLGLLLVVFSLILFVYAVIGVPRIVSTLTLFSYVTASRAWQAMSVIAVFASIWFIGFISEKTIKPIFLSLMVIPFLFFLYRILTDTTYDAYTGVKFLVVVFCIYALATTLMLTKKNGLFYLLILGLTFFSGVTVNPLVKGIGIIEKSSLSQKVKQIAKTNKDAVWVSDATNLYNYLAMFDVETLDGVRFYPDTKLMSKIDSNHQYEDVWNRYSHLHYTLVDEKTKMSLLAPDSIAIDLNIKQLKSLKVKYILSSRPLTSLFGTQFKQVYHGKDGNYIFEFTE